MNKFLLIAALLVLNCSTVFALNCDSPESSLDARECASMILTERDSELNNVYKQVLKVLENEDKSNNDFSSSGYHYQSKKKLIEAQRLWIQFRDKDCDAVGEYSGGGSATPDFILGCLISRTEQRIIELKRFLNF